MCRPRHSTALGRPAINNNTLSLRPTSCSPQDVARYTDCLSGHHAIKLTFLELMRRQRQVAMLIHSLDQPPYQVTSTLAIPLSKWSVPPGYPALAVASARSAIFRVIALNIHI